MKSKISLAFKKCKAEKRPALITYTVAGDNNKINSLKILNAIANHADILELGFPHNTPIADGEQIQDTEWFRIACWNKTAESVNQFLQQGQRCFVEGRFKSSTYTGNDGTQRQSSEVTAFRVIFLDRSNESSNNETSVNNDQPQSFQNNKSNNETKNTTNNDSNSESDDIEELPW